MSKQPTQLFVELVRDEENRGYTASIPDVPVYGEGEAETAAIDDLKQALRLYIEVRGVDQALSLMRPPAVLRPLELDLAELTLG